MVQRQYGAIPPKLLEYLNDENYLPFRSMAGLAAFITFNENSFFWEIMIEATEDKKLFYKLAWGLIPRVEVYKSVQAENRQAVVNDMADFCKGEMLAWRMKQKCVSVIAVFVSLDFLARDCLGILTSFSSFATDQIASNVCSTLRLPIALMFMGLKISLSVIVCKTTLDLGERIRRMLALPLPRNRIQKGMAESAHVAIAIIAGGAAATFIGLNLLRFF